MIRDGVRQRDAIHSAVAPVTAAVRPAPGRLVGHASITGLRHVWSHPAFNAVAATAKTNR